MELSVKIQKRSFPESRIINGRYKIPLKDYYKNPRVYLDFKDETMIDNLQNRRSRPHVKIKKLLSLNKDLMQKLNITNISQLHWSQTAGCSCGCSPGFIISNQNERVDYWLTIE